ncbi:hypothetical protein H632_c710p0 [Helicosporidium sp. ATCC 50920]|nr:hypothetical protein H632_c710p0 [Helicosporidium sp. ATCC 50920]|eukprot:KDD75382.1 hypothetical protein H632_c710p0 [Helicosporidium sp. ATCC 50920]
MAPTDFAVPHTNCLTSIHTKALVVFKIDGEQFTLDLRPGNGSVKQAAPEGKADLTVTVSDENFMKLVKGKLNPQTAFLMRKLKIAGAMSLAMKLEPILEAAAPKSKL